MSSKRLDRVVVIDLESTCWQGKPPEGQSSDIIEIGLCVLDTQTGERSQKTSLLVHPENSSISAFCTELTTLKPEDFKEAHSLKEALQILKTEFHTQDIPWASWGDYDRNQFQRVCQRYGFKYPFGPTHFNVKVLHALMRGLPTALGLKEACEYEGFELEGTHHRGHDDAWNIARILAALIK